MTASRRLLVAFCLMTTTTVVHFAVGCSRQGEGERCSLLNANLDCQSSSSSSGPSLVCRAAASLQNSQIDRCCMDDWSYDVKSCAPRQISGSGGEGGQTSEGGAAGETGSGGGSGGSTPGFGDACSYTSMCPEGLVCTIGGTCGHECLQDRDCASGQVCTAENRCTAGTTN